VQNNQITVNNKADEVKQNQQEENKTQFQAVYYAEDVICGFIIKVLGEEIYTNCTTA
jgi:hypothetical protein